MSEDTQGAENTPGWVMEQMCRESAEASREYTINGDSVRGQYESGVSRGSEEGKIDYLLLRDGPMLKRWAAHLTRAIPKRGRRNWVKARDDEDMERFKRSACRHFEQWLNDEQDEDHAAALFFNVNGVEYMRELRERKPGLLQEEVADQVLARLSQLRTAGL